MGEPSGFFATGTIDVVVVGRRAPCAPELSPCQPLLRPTSPSVALVGGDGDAAAAVRHVVPHQAAALRHVDRLDQEERRDVLDLAARVPRRELDVGDDARCADRSDRARRRRGRRASRTGRRRRRTGRRRPARPSCRRGHAHGHAHGSRLHGVAELGRWSSAGPAPRRERLVDPLDPERPSVGRAVPGARPRHAGIRRLGYAARASHRRRAGRPRRGRTRRHLAGAGHARPGGVLVRRDHRRPRGRAARPSRPAAGAARGRVAWALGPSRPAPCSGSKRRWPPRRSGACIGTTCAR